MKLLALSAGLLCCASAAGPAKKAAGARRAAETCSDAPWHDSDGDDCGAYAYNEWCTRDGKAGTGWDQEWGNLGDFQANGFTALTACCACGGGSAGGSGSSSATRLTYNGCTCKQQWEIDAMTCEHACCNPDDDPVGDWCVVESEMCEDSDWGYCRPEGAGNVMPTYGTSEQHGDCKDYSGWADLDGEGCANYAANAYCTDVGGYGLGWNVEWGSFASYATTVAATTACCACGGGERDASSYPSGWTPGAGTMPRAEDEAKVRETWTGCTCKKEWTEEGIGECKSYCCNPDRDEIGEWCQVEDTDCENSDWGYCLSSGLGTIARPLQDAAHCANVPGWTDTDGDGCEDYLSSAWCTATGGVGAGWHEEEWGTLQSFANHGHTALTACCGCGGGARLNPAEPGTVDALTSLMSPAPEHLHMWRVTEGPCEMDESGCITSGNFPEAYSANERCQIAVDEAKAKPIHVVAFETETTFDALKVNGVIYSGNRGPDGVIPTQTIFWGVDSQNEKGGWKLCHRGEDEAGNPAIKALKVIGIAVVVLLLICCCVIICLTVKQWYSNLPRGDGLGAGPTKVGARIGKAQDV